MGMVDGRKSISYPSRAFFRSRAPKPPCQEINRKALIWRSWATKTAQEEPTDLKRFCPKGSSSSQSNSNTNHDAGKSSINHRKISKLNKWIVGAFVKGGGPGFDNPVL